MTPTDAVATTAPATTGPSSTGASSAGIPDLWFELPPGFTEFDLDEDPEERMLRMAEAVDPLFAEATPEQKFSLVVSGEYILQTMIAAGAEHVSACLLRMPDGELSQATLCVIVERPDAGPENQDRQGTAKRTAVQWREQHPDAEVALIMLPYGPSALCIREQDLQIPGVLFGLDNPIPTTIRQVQFCVPLKTGPGSVLFVFMTEQIDHWAEYLEILSGIMKSVSADEPDWDSQPEADSSPASRGTEQ
ncbi:hypothetical protein RB628_37895 [Streptomyces sp. ADMS]|uniref:hypothetical protein n=1 Tax=Streptomyces sp. ADMS TaxID=3071415 RepID=UPI00296F41B6|nr:hypothetical protein [Streptomyces sp. ADMS]MDW4910939.1 hypothetical protein [Streptomyces sp. ADMS]